MRLIEPKLKSTEHSSDFSQWVPTSFDNLLIELDHVVTSYEGPALFRGQTNNLWPLESSFVRKCIHHLFGLKNYWELNNKIRHSVSFHRSVAALLLLKFGTLWVLNEELLNAEKSHDIDPWFELLKNKQQHPENDNFIEGTHLVDWTVSSDIGLYFSTFQGRGGSHQISMGNGAICVFDAVATDKIKQVKKLGEILGLMKGEKFLNAEAGLPLMFHPEKQTNQQRAANQLPVYIAQMDYRCDLAEFWLSYEKQHNKRISITLVVNENIKNDIANYLTSKGITEDKVYPV